MTNLPIRGLGSVGAITDIDPYSLPINAYTRAKNVRFNEGKVTRAPIYSISIDQPQHQYIEYPAQLILLHYLTGLLV